MIMTERVYSDNSVKTMPNLTKGRPEMDFQCHFAYKNGHKSLVLFWVLHSVIRTYLFFCRGLLFIFVFTKTNIKLQMLTLASYCKEVMEKGSIVQVAMLVLVLAGVGSTMIAEYKQQTVYYVAKQQFHQNHCRAILILQPSGVKIWYAQRVKTIESNW